jgi:3-phosphoshikimate 1-carboxyvinyltransferase
MRIVVTPATEPLRGTVPGPIDRDAATFALAIAALARGAESLLEGRGIPDLALVPALEALGVAVEGVRDADGRRTALRVRGVGLEGLRRPAEPLDAGRDAAAMTALAALGVALPFDTRLVGEPQTMRETMAPIARVLRQRSATIEGVLAAPGPNLRVGSLEPPVDLGPTDVPLSPLSFELGGLDESPSTRALVKAAALLSGLGAEGTTQLFERVIGEDLVPRLLGAAGVEIRSLGPVTELDGPVRLGAMRGELPVDATLAAGLVASGLQVPESLVGVRRVPTRPTARGWLEALSDAGARLHIEPKRDALGQPASDVRLQFGLARPLALGGERANRLGIALPVLATAALRAPEGTESLLFDVGPHDAPELRSTLELIDAFGGRAALVEDGIVVVGEGSRRLQATTFHASGDASLALAAIVLALGCDGPSTIADVGALFERFPRLLATYRALGANVASSTDSPEETGDASHAPTRPPSL